MTNDFPHETLIPVQPSIKAHAAITEETYQHLYQTSIEEPDTFWKDQALSLIDWIKPFTKVNNASFAGNIDIRWFEDGVLNVSANCIDRHLPKRANQTAIIWESDDPTKSETITYQQLHDHVCKLANALKAQGIGKGDRVVIYLPMIKEAAFAMLACARIGAIHSVIFGGFSPDAIASRIDDTRPKAIITAVEGLRGGKNIPLKSNIDKALTMLTTPIPSCVITVLHGGTPVSWEPKRDKWYHELVDGQSTNFPPEPMNAEDPLFILYTSGSTGKPKGVLHTTGGYIVFAAATHKTIFDLHENDVYWCTADIGWITGHSYLIYGPLANGTTTLMFEGVPNYPDFSRFWQVIDKHKVTIFYTAPTAIRALMREGDSFVTSTKRDSLRILGTVGEPINPEAWLWYYHIVGNGRCPIVDTWWQTETGGILIAPLPGATALKPGSATHPFFGIEPAIVDANGKILTGEAEGSLVITSSWPGQMRTVYEDHDRFVKTYFSQFPGYFFTGDGARRDKDGYYWITGRVDDVLNVSGHRLGTAEIESALVSHPTVAEAAVVGFPHDIKGQGIYCYVILKRSEIASSALEKELRETVRKIISPIATPDVIHIVSGLPKTRSGKIMRRILRKIAVNDFEDFGNLNTLTNPEVVEEIITERKKIHVG